MKFKSLEGSERIRFLGEGTFDQLYLDTVFGEICSGKHCAEHKPNSHAWTNRVKGTGKAFTTRVRCTGPNCKICEAFREG